MPVAQRPARQYGSAAHLTGHPRRFKLSPETLLDLWVEYYQSLSHPPTPRRVGFVEWVQQHRPGNRLTRQTFINYCRGYCFDFPLWTPTRDGRPLLVYLSADDGLGNKILWASPNVEQVLGYQQGALVGEFGKNVLKPGEDDDLLYYAGVHARKDPGNASAIRTTLTAFDGRRLPFDMTLCYSERARMWVVQAVLVDELNAARLPDLVALNHFGSLVLMDVKATSSISNVDGLVFRTGSRLAQGG